MFGASVKEHHGFPAMATVQECSYRFGIGMAQNGPKSKASNSGADGFAYERNRVRSVGLKDGKAVIAGDADVSSEHEQVIARIDIGNQGSSRQFRRGLWQRPGSCNSGLASPVQGNPGIVAGGAHIGKLLVRIGRLGMVVG